jgi:hypothetical protein
MKMLNKMSVLHVRRSAAVLLGAALALVVAQPAQAATPNKMTADVPFDFVVAGRTMPAGNYVIEVGPGMEAPSVVSLQTTKSTDDDLHFKNVLVVTTPADRVDDKQPHLVFEKIGDLYFLDKVVPRSGTVKEVRGAPEK